jgi:FAD/FMN-containing dehydrogenase
MRAMLSMPDLTDQLQGRVITPEDPDYDQARTVFVGNVDRRPAAVVRVANADDVARVIAIARDGGLELAVRSGGHSGAGHGVSEGGIVIDLADMRAIEIDPEARTAWAEAGLTAGEYTTAAGSHGLATGFGDAGFVGIGGLTLGGGVGLLARKHGLTIDDVLGADVVTADGELLRVDADNHPDLYWAIRGGGGNFGVVTRFHYRLHPVDEIVGGMLFLPGTPEGIAGFVAEADAAPEELSAVANVMPAPPLPFIPAEQHGRLVVMALIVYAGPVEEGERAVARLRALAEPVADMVRPMKYPEIYQPAEEGYHPSAASRTLFLDGLDQRAAETIVERIEARPGQMAATQLRVLGGAVARVPAEATAFAHRGRKVMVNVAALYQQPDERAAHEAWVAETAAALSDGTEGAYVAFLADEGEERVREAYPGATWDRLAEVKARYDPDNLFRLNQNVPPAAG